MYNIAIELRRVITDKTETLNFPQFVSASAAHDWRHDMLRRLQAEGWKDDLMTPVFRFEGIPMVLSMHSPCHKLKVSLWVQPLVAEQTVPQSVPEALGMVEKLFVRA